MRRYLPQVRLPGWDQEALPQKSALIIGVGGLGTPAALYLAAMGIGKLFLVDPDTIAEENLHRQPLYLPTQIGRLKVEALSAYLKAFRPDMVIETYPVWVDAPFLQTVGPQADIWIDGTDNLQSRLLIDAQASAIGKPWVYGAIFQWEGQAALWQGLRYKDFFGEAEGGPSCSEAGVLGGLPGIIGSLQATLAAQYLSDPTSAPVNRLFTIDLRRGETHTFLLAPSTSLPLEIALAQAYTLPQPLWIDLREEPKKPLPFPHQRWRWYQWDTWELPSQPIVFVCETGQRSRQVAFLLRKKTGRTNLYSLRGGTQALL